MQRFNPTAEYTSEIVLFAKGHLSEQRAKMPHTKHCAPNKCNLNDYITQFHNIVLSFMALPLLALKIKTKGNIFQLSAGTWPVGKGQVICRKVDLSAAKQTCGSGVPCHGDSFLVPGEQWQQQAVCLWESGDLLRQVMPCQVYQCLSSSIFYLDEWEKQCCRCC